MGDESVWSVEEIDEHTLIFEDLVGDVGFSRIGMEGVMQHLSDHAPHWAVFLGVLVHGVKQTIIALIEDSFVEGNHSRGNLPTYQEANSSSVANQVLRYVRIWPIRVNVAALI